MRPSRTNKVPKPWLQFKLIQPFLATAVICIVFQYGVVQSGLSALLMEDPAAAELPDKAAAVTLRSLYITLAVTIPLIFALGTFFTFRVVGPIYCLEKYLKSIISGQDPGSGVSIFASSAEYLWCCYAWPATRNNSGNRTFFINQGGDILTCRNNTARYSGTITIPAGTAAVIASAGSPNMATSIAANATGQDGERWLIVN